jgi:hypothetical protein
MALAALTAGPIPADASDPTPTLSAEAALRGIGSHVLGSGFVPGQGYTLSADRGVFPGSGTSSVDVTAENDPSQPAGTFQVFYKLPGDTPVDVTSVQITATAAGSTTPAATVTIEVAPPALDGEACPGAAASGSGAGFPDGDYTLSSPSVTFSPSTVNVSDSSLRLAGTAIAALHRQFPVTATLDDAAHTAYTFQWTMIDSWETTDWYAGFSRKTITFNCFAPHESVSVHRLDARTKGPATARADSAGVVTVPLALLPASQPSRTLGLRLTGRTSQQTVTGGTESIAGSSLLAGHTLSMHQAINYHVVSSDARFEFGENHCQAFVEYGFSDGGEALHWSTPRIENAPADCVVKLLSSGDLVLRTTSGKVLWHTGTSGSGSHNRLIMQTDGDAVIYNAAGHSVWSSFHGKR